MYWLFRNLPVFGVAILLASLAWVFGGSRGDWLPKFVPWLLLFMAEMALCFPQCRKGEVMGEARERVWRALKDDPIVWLVVGFIVMLMIPFVNNGLCTYCDAEAIAAGGREGPKLWFLPFCVNVEDHLNVFLWFLCALLSMLATRHALLKRGKRLLIEILVWNGVLLGVFGVIQQLYGATAPWWTADDGSAYFFSTFGYPNMAGDYFTALFILSIAVWRRRMDEVAKEVSESDDEGGWKHSYKRFWKRHYMVIAALVLFGSALATLSRSAIMLSSVAAIVLALHAGICYLKRLKKVARVKAGAMIALVVILLAVLATAITPGEVQREMGTVKTNEMLDRLTGRSEQHSRIAAELIADHPLFGCGGWGYVHFCLSKMPPEMVKSVGMGYGGANVHNDYMQFICEHGILGFLILVAIACMLLIPVGFAWRRLFRATRFVTGSRRHQTPSPKAIFALPASAFAMLLAILATLIHAFADCPLRSPAVLSLLFVEMASVVGYLPNIIAGSEGSESSKAETEAKTESETESESKKEGHHHAARK